MSTPQKPSRPQVTRFMDSMRARMLWWVAEEYSERPYRGSGDRILSIVTIALALLAVGVLAGLTMAAP